MDDPDVREVAAVHHLPPIREPGHAVETVALRGLAVLLAPVVFATMFTVALASIPAAGLRWALSRS